MSRGIYIRHMIISHESSLPVTFFRFNIEFGFWILRFDLANGPAHPHSKVSRDRPVTTTGYQCSVIYVHYYFQQRSMIKVSCTGRNNILSKTEHRSKRAVRTPRAEALYSSFLWSHGTLTYDYVVLVHAVLCCCSIVIYDKRRRSREQQE